MEDVVADAHRRDSAHPGPGAPGIRIPVLALSTAAGCISQAAAAIRTLSGSARSRPPAKAWRNAASENATARPIDFA